MINNMAVSTEYVCVRLSEETGYLVLYNPSKKSFVAIEDGKNVRTIVRCIHNPLQIRINIFLSPKNVSLIAKFYKNDLEDNDD